MYLDLGIKVKLNYMIALNLYAKTISSYTYCDSQLVKEGEICNASVYPELSWKIKFLKKKITKHYTLQNMDITFTDNHKSLLFW